MISRRDLAASVRRIFVSCKLTHPVERDRADIDAILEEAARTRGIPLSDFLASCRFRRRTYADPRYRHRGNVLAAMLVACLPNLTCFAVKAFDPDNAIPPRVLLAAGMPLLPFETFDLYGNGGSMPHEIGRTFEMSFFTLKTLNIRSCGLLRMRIPERPFPNLRHVGLTNSGVSLSNVRSVLALSLIHI